MKLTALLAPHLDGGLRHTNFFNGRLLSAEDLQLEQLANHHHQEQLGQAIGEGIVRGLWVSVGANGANPTLRVSCGLAINRRGHALELPEDAEVALVTEATQVEAEAGLFGECKPVAGTSVLAGKGVHVLVIGPASAFRERAPMQRFDDDGRASHCGDRFVVEGLKFRLAGLDVTNPALVPDDLGSELGPLIAAADDASLSIARSLLAHACFGTRELAEFPLRPFDRADQRSPFLIYGALDHLRVAKAIDDCEIALALLLWTDAGIQILDNWAVRRPPAMPSALDPWPLHAGYRRRVEAEAMFLEFQEHLAHIQEKETGLTSLEASQRFGFLPGAGYLPLGAGGFDKGKFFEKFDVLEQSLDPAFLRRWVHDSWFIEPIDLRSKSLPPLLVLNPPDADYIVFVRDQAAEAKIPTTPEPEPTAEPPTAGTQGVFEISVIPDPKSAGKEPNILNVPIFDIKKDIAVEVEDTLGHRHTAKLRALGTISQTFSSIIRSKQWPVFITGKLDFGNYTIHVRAKGFLAADKMQNLNEPRERVTIPLVVDQKGKGPTITPGKGVDVSDHPSGLWDKLYPELEKIGPWPPEELPSVDPLWDPVPDEEYGALVDLFDKLKKDQPGITGNPADIKVLVQRGHSTEAIPDKDYAFIVFGEGGSFVPAILVPKSRSFGIPVGLGRSGIAGLDRDTQLRLEAAGIADLSVLSAAPKKLVADALGFDLAGAGSLIDDSREKVGQLLEDESFTIFGGVDSALDGDLKQGGISSKVDLANATPERLVVLGGQHGMTLNLAQRIIAQARNSLPDSSFSLRDAGLGLRKADLDALEKRGIATLGSWTAKAGTAAGRDELAATIGVSKDDIAEISKTIDSKLNVTKSEVKTRHKAAAFVGSIVGVDEKAADQLAKAGFATAGALAKMDADAAKTFFGGNKAAAAGAIMKARESLGLQD